MVVEAVVDVDVVDVALACRCKSGWDWPTVAGGSVRLRLFGPLGCVGTLTRRVASSGAANSTRT